LYNNNLGNEVLLLVVGVAALYADVEGISREPFNNKELSCSNSCFDDENEPFIN
jgi:hypothetical protein